jgi:hypothetical protein
MQKRNRVVQTISLKERLAAFAKESRKKAERLPPGTKREEMLKKVMLADNASHLDDWANSRELRPPK